ncbi:MAG: GNAT family N-acetyltransferase [Bacilli bacterium]|nr:GNAT family N-acetyltransferase [Bacilli bacterium]
MIYPAHEFTLKNGLKVLIKSPEISDAKMLLDNVVNVCKTTPFLLSEVEDYDKYYQNMKLEEDFIASFINNKDYLLCVYLNGVIIGNSALRFNSHVKDSHRVNIGIAIQEEYQGIGIGSILFDIMIDLAKHSEGIEQIELGVIANNEKAKRLYTKKGFVKTGDIPHELKLKDGTYLDGETMVLFLNK